MDTDKGPAVWCGSHGQGGWGSDEGEGPLEETGVRETQETECLSAQWPGSKPEPILILSAGHPDSAADPVGSVPKGASKPPPAPAAAPTRAHPVLSCLDGSNGFAVVVLLSLLQHLLYRALWVSF